MQGPLDVLPDQLRLPITPSGHAPDRPGHAPDRFPGTAPGHVSGPFMWALCPHTDTPWTHILALNRHHPGHAPNPGVPVPAFPRRPSTALALVLVWLPRRPFPTFCPHTARPFHLHSAFTF